MTDKIVILYIDDEEHNLNSFAAHFRRNKRFLILTAKSGKEGRDILKVVNADIIVADQKMPGMTGVEFLNEVNQEPEPVKIVVTAHRDIAAIIKAYEENRIFRYHIKPWDWNDLEESIEGALKRKVRKLC